MKVLALVPYTLGRAPGQRYRIEQWGPYLAEEGIELSFSSFASPALMDLLYEPGHWLRKSWLMMEGWARTLTRAARVQAYDAVFIHREASLVGPAWPERLARWAAPRVVYDFDDAVWVPYRSPTHSFFSLLKFPWKTASLCRMASAVIAGNDHLAEYARRYNGNVHVVPSTVSLREYTARPVGRTGDAPVVGWTGSHSSIQYLDLVLPALRQLRERMAFRFLIIGVEGIDLPGLEVQCRSWRASTEARDLWDMDVGIMPLPDEPWARGKCGMKLIQYMGVGVPAVASPVGANRQIVEHGVTGLLATNKEEWVASLERLLRDAALRVELGRNARRVVEKRYSAEVQAPRVAGILRGLVR
ncbi:MAG: hypothetical protein A2V74_00945 [Acidobacteria bacterium RBG_16_70_10]|nr:MAG: hypothetical protein A2V74_00945 [Acidobacteria bacterium RBG_16_70_10]